MEINEEKAAKSEEGTSDKLREKRQKVDDVGSLSHYIYHIIIL